MRDVDDQTFGALPRQLRRGAGLTQEDLAEQAEISPRGLGYLEQAAASFARCLRLAHPGGSRWLIPSALEGLAGLAGVQYCMERAALLFAAASDRAALGTPRRPALRTFYEHDVATAPLWAHLISPTPGPPVRHSP